MSMTKRQFHEEICSRMADADEAEYQAWFDWREKQAEREIDWFDDYRLSYDGYEEFDEPIFSSNVIDDDLPF